MAGRSAIGLDIGTSGVRAAELSFGKGQVTLEKFGQVALPAGAVRDGEVDWLVIPQAAVGAPGAPMPPSITPPSGANPANPNAKPQLPGVPLKDYAGGPFVGVRPPISGKSMIPFGPFMLAGALVAILWGGALGDLYLDSVVG